MSIGWIAPAALAGLALVALPIAVHLLVRQHARVLAYPSLRFLRETQLAALRRRTIQDAMLLLCRAAVIAIAAMALAGPVLQSPSRQAGYANRTSRAVVTIDPVDRPLVAKAVEGAFVSATFGRSKVADALADAVRWLNQQPASAREIVVAGELRRGAVAESDLAAVPAGIGIRFQPATFDSRADLVVPTLLRRDGILSRVDRQVQASVDATRVIDAAAVPVAADLVTIVAAPPDTELAEAALGAALDAGIPWTDFAQRIVIAWEGAADPSLSGTRVIRMPVPSPPAFAADAVHDVLAGVSPPDLKDPVPITAEQLASWTRAPGPPAPDAPVSDEGDRRWLWRLVLVLLAIEWWMRRSRPALVAQSADHAGEARVA